MRISIFHLFNFSHSRVVAASVTLVYIYLVVNDDEPLSQVCIGHLDVFSSEVSNQVIYPGFNWVVCLFIIEL